MRTLALALAVTCSLVAPTRAADYVVEVTGTPGLKFIGNCRMTGAPSGQEYAEFDGLVPDALLVAARTLSCVVQKYDARGRINVRLLLNGVELRGATTASPFGYIQVIWDEASDEGQARRGYVPLPQVTPVPRDVQPRNPGPVPPFSGAPLPPPLEPQRPTRQR